MFKLMVKKIITILLLNSFLIYAYTEYVRVLAPKFQTSDYDFIADKKFARHARRLIGDKELH